MADVVEWTDEELADEMASWAANGEGARLPAQFAYLAQSEYDRRLGPARTRQEWKDHYSSALSSARS